MPGLLPSSEPKHAVLPPWVFLILGSLALGYVGQVYIRQRQFLAHAARTQGVIVGNWQEQFKGTTHYTAIFTFSDAGGNTRRVFEPNHRSKTVPTPAGWACWVVYNPDNPAQAEIEFPNVLADVCARTGLSLLIGGVLLLRGLLSYGHAWYKRLRQPPNNNGGVPRDPAILAGP